MKTMKMQLIGWTAAAALLFGAAACGSQAGSAAAQPETAAETGVLEVDALLADAEGRIADFRQRIGERQLATGKDYLSFYFVEASGYAIE